MDALSCEQSRERAAPLVSWTTECEARMRSINSRQRGLTNAKPIVRGEKAVR